MILGVTGHRPHRLGGDQEIGNGQLSRFARQCLEQLTPDEVNVGMALGWDTAVAIACTALGIPFTAYVPHLAQAARWRPHERMTYDAILRCAKTVIMVNSTYTRTCMAERNVAIVQNSSRLLALHDGAPAGGTYNCIQYARMRGVPVVNVWQDWTRFGELRTDLKAAA